MIGGKDVSIFTTLNELGLVKLVKRVIEIAWPNYVLETVWDSVTKQYDMFVYKNYKSKDVWDEKGWTKRHGKNMIHISLSNGRLGFVFEPATEWLVSEIIREHDK